MADGTPEPEYNIPYRAVKGFPGLGVDFLRFPYQVPDCASCKLCKCIPKKMYYLLCPHHGLCLDCKRYCNGYYCDECCIHTTPEQLGAVRSCFNDDIKYLPVLCHVCDKKLLLGQMEEHLCEHTNQGRMEASKVQETTNQEHHENSGQDPVTCSLCHLLVQPDNFWKHTLLSCTERTIDCELCHSSFPCSAEETHKYQCPKMARECTDCGVNVLNENVKNHLDTECQKRVVLCGACKSAMSYDERGDHDQECPERPVFCDECEGEMPRKEKSKHASECPMRVVHCENCKGFYAFSLEKDHREQCETKKLACEYCKLDLKGDDDKDAHLEICEDAPIECTFKDFGCKEKSPRKEMLEHNKDPHNALLNQVILKAMDTISELQQKIKDMERCNMSQQEEAKNKEAKLVKKIQELENRQMSKQEEARNENAKLVKRIQELENRQLEADQYCINLEDDVKVYRTVLQNLEDKVGRISKEAVTRRRVEMLNERVETYLGPMERLLNGLRQVDNE